MNTYLFDLIVSGASRQGVHQNQWEHGGRDLREEPRELDSFRARGRRGGHAGQSAHGKHGGRGGGRNQGARRRDNYSNPLPQKKHHNMHLSFTPDAKHLKTVTPPCYTLSAANKDCYYRVVEAEGRDAPIPHDFTLNTNTDFFGDLRVKYGWITPRPHFQLGDNNVNLASSASFVGGTCHSCYSGHKNHTLNEKPRLFMAGDQFLPPVVGTQGSCCPVMRVNDGSFQQLKDLITFQIAQGLRFPRGSILCTFMLSHLLKIGANLYWSEVVSFIEWMNDNHGVTVLPGIPPYPCGLEAQQLVSLSQFFHYLLGSYFGKGPVRNDSSYSLWKPFQITAAELKTTSVHVHAPPIMIQEANHLFYCGQVFVSGFEGDWSKQVPGNIQITFFNNLFAALEEFKLSLPATSDMQTSINNKPLQGRKVYLAGTSILRATLPYITNTAHAKGVEVIADFSKGDFLRYIKEINSGHFLQASSEDILVLSFLGNYLLNKDDVLNADCCHLVNPTIPSDSSMSTLVIEVGRLMRTLSEAFPGRIYLLGPLERHLESCCSKPEHRIKGPNNEDINMALYTKAFSTFIHASPGIIQGRVKFVYQQEIFFNDFNSTFLVDGVHINAEATTRLATFICNLLTAKKASKIPTITNDDFITHLSKYGVITGTNDDDQDEDLDSHMDAPIDNAIMLAES